MAGWTCVEEIVAYQLAVELRDQVLALIDGNTIPRDYKLRDQLAAATRSVPANISEGFHRYNHGEFKFLANVAIGSLGETATHLDEARTRGYISEDCHRELLKLVERTRKTTNGLLRHLSTTKAPAPYSRPTPNRSQ